MAEPEHEEPQIFGPWKKRPNMEEPKEDYTPSSPNRKIEELKPYVQRYKERTCFDGEYLVQGTDKDNWDCFWYVNTKISKHMSPNMGLFKKLKSCFIVDTKEHTCNIIFTHGIGGIDLKTNENEYSIPYVSYVPDININLLSMKQLILQGFEVDIDGMSCKISHIFDTEKGHDAQVFEEESGMQKQDAYLEKFFNELDNSIDVVKSDEKVEDDWEVISLSIENIEQFVKLLDLINNNHFVMAHKDLFRNAFERALSWYHENYTNSKLNLPIKLFGVKICLLDLYKIVESNGGYESVTSRGKWEGMAKGLGFPIDFQDGLKEIYDACLVHPQGYFEFAKKAEEWQSKHSSELDVIGTTKGIVGHGEPSIEGCIEQGCNVDAKKDVNTKETTSNVKGKIGENTSNYIEEKMARDEDASVSVKKEEGDDFVIIM